MYNFYEFPRARHCLKFLVNYLKIKEIFIPYYLCDVIRHTLFQEECKIKFYHIDDNLMPEIEFDKNSYILYPNYFGICAQNVKLMSLKYPKLIVDNAHAFYDEPLGIAGFNSGIKFGFGEKAFLWVNSDLMNENSIIKFEYNEAQKQKRKEVFKKLHENYAEQNKLNIRISEEFSPFCYPLLLETVSEADKIVKSLQNHGIVIYRYWNNLPESFNEYKFYSRLVPIPIITK